MHKSYSPHFDGPASSTKDTPHSQAPLAEVGEPSTQGGARGHRRNADAIISGWVPLASYFKLFFEGIHV